MNDQQMNGVNGIPNQTPQVNPGVTPVQPGVVAQPQVTAPVQPQVVQPGAVAQPQVAQTVQPQAVVAPQVATPVQPQAPVQPTIAAPNLAAASMTTLSNVGEPVNQATQVGTTPTQNSNIAAATTGTQTPEQIAAGIQNGSFVNAISDPNTLLGKEGTTLNTTEEEAQKKKAKKNIIKLVVIIVVIAIIAGVGFYFYKKEYTTSGTRIDAFINGVNSYLTPIITDCESRLGNYDLQVDVTQDTDKYGVHASGDYAYDLADYIHLNGEVDSIISKDELLGKSPIKYDFYLNDSKFYAKFEDLYEKYIYTEYTELDELMTNIKQNDVAYETAHQMVVNAVKSGIKAGGVSQKVGSATIDGSSKQANIVTVNINKYTLASIQSAFYTQLANNSTFVTEYAKVIGATEEDTVKKLTKAGEKEITYDGNATVKLYSSVFGTDFLGLDVVFSYNDKSYTASMIPVSNGYKFILVESGNKLLNLSVTRTPEYSADLTKYNNVVAGDVYYKDKLYQVSSTLSIGINIPYQSDKAIVKDSINVKYLSTTDFESIFNNAKDKYNVAGSKIYSKRQEILDDISSFAKLETPIVLETEEVSTDTTTPATN